MAVVVDTGDAKECSTNGGKIVLMAASPSEDPPKASQYVEFSNSRFYLGKKFLFALLLIAITIAVSAFSDSNQISGRILTAITGILGILIGLLLQPSPKPEDHKPRARAAINSLKSSIDLIIDVIRIAGQIGQVDDIERVRIGLATMEQDLNRSSDQIIISMAEWDHVAPGAVQEFKESQERGHQILMELAKNKNNKEQK